MQEENFPSPGTLNDGDDLLPPTLLGSLQESGGPAPPTLLGSQPSTRRLGTKKRQLPYLIFADEPVEKISGVACRSEVQRQRSPATFSERVRIEPPFAGTLSPRHESRRNAGRAPQDESSGTSPGGPPAPAATNDGQNRPGSQQHCTNFYPEIPFPSPTAGMSMSSSANATPTWERDYISWDSLVNLYNEERKENRRLQNL